MDFLESPYASCPTHGVAVAEWEPNGEQAILQEGC